MWYGETTTTACSLGRWALKAHAKMPFVFHTLFLFGYLSYIYFLYNVKSIFYFFINGKRSRLSALDIPVLNLTPSKFDSCLSCGNPAIIVIEMGPISVGPLFFFQARSENVRWEPISPEHLKSTACLAYYLEMNTEYCSVCQRTFLCYLLTGSVVYIFFKK